MRDFDTTGFTKKQLDDILKLVDSERKHFLCARFFKSCFYVAGQLTWVTFSYLGDQL